MHRALRTALCGLSLGLSLPCLAGCEDRPRPEAAKRVDVVRQGLLERINTHRRAAGSSPLSLDPAVGLAADAHATEIEERGNLDLPAGSGDEMQDRLFAAGYEAQRWVESIVATSAPLDSWIADWQKEQPRDFARAMDPDLKHLGIGLAEMGELRLLVILVTAPAAEAFERETTPVADLAANRKKLLEQLNAFRRKEGLHGRLASSSTLDRIAQKHADDMLARGYFAHQSPDGKTVRERAQREGYRWRALGENLADGQTRIEQLLANWKDSPPHRAVLLDPAMEEIGLGMARGRDGRGQLRIVWVLVAGAPRG